MAGDATNVRIGVSGLAYTAIVGSTVPSTLTGAWAAAWTDLGLILKEDGLTEAMDMERNEFFAWGYQSPVRSQVLRKTITFRAVFLESKAHVLSLYHAHPLSGMTSSGSGADQALTWTQGQSSDPDVRALGLDIIDGTKRNRFIVPRAEVTERGDIVYKEDDMVQYDMTFTALLASDGSSVQRMYGGVAAPV
jgi:hypothetical protein